MQLTRHKSTSRHCYHSDVIFWDFGRQYMFFGLCFCMGVNQKYGSLKFASSLVEEGGFCCLLGCIFHHFLHGIDTEQVVRRACPQTHPYFPPGQAGKWQMCSPLTFLSWWSCRDDVIINQRWHSILVTPKQLNITTKISRVLAATPKP